MHACMHAHTHAHKHTHKHIHTQTHTHTNTHTHTEFVNKSNFKKPGAFGQHPPGLRNQICSVTCKQQYTW